ncbi:MAG: prolyl oligopeptidase family serine peptidase [Pseudomonadota bacterium]
MTAPAGSWPSPITAEMIAAGSIRIGGIGVHNGTPVWLESRASEGGRGVIVGVGADGEPVDLSPSTVSVRSRVNEYGGGALWSLGEHGIAIVDDLNGGALSILSDGDVKPLVMKDGWRFADGHFVGGDTIVCVVEIHDGDHHPSQKIVQISLATGNFEIVHGGRDFYAAPRLSPDGARLAFLAWDLPYMPWQAAELWELDLTKGAPGRLLGGGLNRAAFQPEWREDGVLFAALEGRSGSHVHWFDPDRGWRVALKTEGEAHRPLWGLGTRSYALLPGDRICVSHLVDGKCALSFGTVGQEPDRRIDDFADFSDPHALGDDQVFGVAAWWDRASALSTIKGEGTTQTIKPLGPEPENAASTSAGEIMALETDSGTIHAVYYSPWLEGHALAVGEKPPVIVKAHGGPTGYADRGYGLKTQYWTTRGFAVLDVDYRGSFGYGPDYRRALDGEMGIIDIKDVVDASEALANAGIVDPGALFVSGGSAGGYVVLGALAFHDVFRAGCSRYGIGDLKKLADLTHKFEAGYLDTLLGLTGVPDDQAIFQDRSPVHSAGQIKAATLLLQGADDKIVPPSQSQEMARALESAGVPVAYVEYEGEGHGFRGADAVVHSLEAELAFFRTVLGAETEPLDPPLDIKNRDRLT